MRVIIRRPHAYFILQDMLSGEGGLVDASDSGVVSAEGTNLPIPGIYLLDAQGKLLDYTSFTTPRELVEKLEKARAR